MEALRAAPRLALIALAPMMRMLRRARRRAGGGGCRIDTTALRLMIRLPRWTRVIVSRGFVGSLVMPMESRRRRWGRMMWCAT
jgi:hypothetical protein